VSEPHATYQVATDAPTQKRIARVRIIVDGVKYGAFLPADHDILDDQAALDTYMMSVVRRAQRKDGSE
jgi:hypothetical protein